MFVIVLLFECTTLDWMNAIQRAKGLKDSMSHKDVAHYFKLILNSKHKAADNSPSSDNALILINLSFELVKAYPGLA